MIVSLYLGTKVIEAAVIVRLLKRAHPRLTTLPTSIESNISVASCLSTEEREIIKDAFTNGPDIEWIVNGGVPAEASSDEEKERYRLVTNYIIECVLRFTENYGHVIVSRGTDGSFLGAICLIPPYARRWMYSLHFYRSILPLGKAVPKQMGADIADRYETFISAIEREHTSATKGTPHWHITNLAVAKDAQGAGVGRALLATAFELAGSVPIYVECHQGNAEFFEKMGFSTTKQFMILPKKAKCNVPLAISGMLRGKHEESFVDPSMVPLLIREHD